MSGGMGRKKSRTSLPWMFGCDPNRVWLAVARDSLMRALRIFWKSYSGGGNRLNLQTRVTFPALYSITKPNSEFNHVLIRQEKILR